MMCGVLAITSQHNKDAQTFLERATGIDPQSVEAWTLLGETCHLSLLLVFKVVFCIKK